MIRMFVLALPLALAGWTACADEYRIAVMDYRYAEVWHAVADAMQQADPANHYRFMGILPARRLIAEGKAGQFDCFMPSGRNGEGKSLFGFEHTSAFAFYRTDLVLLSRRGDPPLDGQGKPTGEIEAMPGTEPLLPFPVSTSNQQEQSVRKLLVGRLAGVVAGRPVLERLIHQEGADQRVDWKPIVSGEVTVGFIDQPGWQLRAKHVDVLLEKLRQDGTLAKLLAPIIGDRPIGQ